MSKQKFFLITLYILALLCFIFITLPIINTFFSVNLNSLKETLKDGEVWKSIGTTLEGATFSTIFGILIGVPGALFLSESKFKGKKFLESLINLPIVIPHVVVGIILLKLLNPDSLLGKLFSKAGISFVDTIYGVIVAMCFVSISYTITSSLLGFKSVNRNLTWAARSLGASPLQVLRYIILPSVFPYILRGAILSFARAVSEVGSLLIIAYYPMTAPILMYERFTDYGLKASMPIAVLIVLISLLIFILLLSVSSRLKKTDA